MALWWEGGPGSWSAESGRRTVDVKPEWEQGPGCSGHLGLHRSLMFILEGFEAGGWGGS